MADTLNARFTDCLYYKIIVVNVEMLMLKYFLEYNTNFVAEYLHG